MAPIHLSLLITATTTTTTILSPTTCQPDVHSWDWLILILAALTAVTSCITFCCWASAAATANRAATSSSDSCALVAPIISVANMEEWLNNCQAASMTPPTTSPPPTEPVTEPHDTVSITESSASELERPKMAYSYSDSDLGAALARAEEDRMTDINPDVCETSGAQPIDSPVTVPATNSAMPAPIIMPDSSSSDQSASSSPAVDTVIFSLMLDYLLIKAMALVTPISRMTEMSVNEALMHLDPLLAKFMLETDEGAKILLELKNQVLQRRMQTDRDKAHDTRGSASPSPPPRSEASVSANRVTHSPSGRLASRAPPSKTSGPTPPLRRTAAPLPSGPWQSERARQARVDRRQQQQQRSWPEQSSSTPFNRPGLLNQQSTTSPTPIPQRSVFGPLLMGPDQPRQTGAYVPPHLRANYKQSEQDCSANQKRFVRYVSTPEGWKQIASVMNNVSKLTGVEVNHAWGFDTAVMS